MGTALKYPTYNIGEWGANWQDDNGAIWYVETSDIRDGLAPKTHVDERTSGHGAWRARSYLSSKAFVVAGYGRAPDLPGRELARDTLLGLFIDGEQQMLTYDSGASVRTLEVELNGTPRFAVRRNKTGFGWQLPLLCAKGYWESVDTKNTAPVQVSSAPTDGLDWGSGGLDWGSGGLDWGTSGVQGTITIDNAGNLPAWPVFTFAGPVLQPSLTDPLTGRQLLYSGQVLAGQTLVIDTSPDTRSVTLDGVDRFGYMLSAQWMSVPPRSSLVLQFGGSGLGTVVGSLKDAYV